MAQIDRTLQDAITSLSPAEALAAAKRFFTRRNAVYAAFIDMEGPDWLTLRGQGGEEVAFAARPHNGATRVTGSTYLFDQQVARFLATLPVAEGADVVAQNPTLQELPAAGEGAA
jgi:hypothetical protein